MFKSDRSWRPVAALPAYLGLVLFIAAGSARAYTYNNLGEAGGWDDVEKGSTTSYVLDRSDYTQDLNLSQQQITGALNSAFTTWSSVEGSSLSLVENSDQGGNYDVFDGPNDTAGPPWFGGSAGDSLDQQGDYLYANITFGGWLPNSYFDYLEDGSIDGAFSSILGVTWTGKIRGSLSKKPRWVAEVFFNDAWTWSLDGDDPATGEYEIDIETVMLHELGHAVGFGHEDLATAVMNPYYDGVQLDLYQDDIDGAVSLYPEGGKKGGDGGGGGKPPWAGGGKLGAFSFFSIEEYDALLQSSATSVPEPATLILFASGVAVFARRRIRR